MPTPCLVSDVLVARLWWGNTSAFCVCEVVGPSGAKHANIPRLRAAAPSLRAKVAAAMTLPRLLVGPPVLSTQVTVVPPPGQRRSGGSVRSVGMGDGPVTPILRASDVVLRVNGTVCTLEGDELIESVESLGPDDGSDDAV
jgi:hypothetical protein